MFHGTRYNPKTPEIHYRGKNIAEMLAPTVEGAWEFFADALDVCRSLKVLREVGLDDLRLGQPAAEFSGGEAQRTAWPRARTLISASPYRKRFRQGATLTPRRFFLVEHVAAGRLQSRRDAPRLRGGEARFVFPDRHGKGAGLMLGQAIVAEARRLGHRRMRLDTGPAQREAQGLYRRLGFRETGPCYDLTPRLRDWLVFMELDLAA